MEHKLKNTKTHKKHSCATEHHNEESRAADRDVFDDTTELPLEGSPVDQCPGLSQDILRKFPQIRISRLNIAHPYTVRNARKKC